MPWEHCGQPVPDDQELCPACGVTKAQWTVEWNVTRTFRVGGRRSPFVRVRVVDDQDAPVTGERVEAVGPDGVTVEGVLDDLGAAKLRAEVDGMYRVRFPDRAPGEVVREADAEGEAEGAPAPDDDDDGFAVERGRALNARLRPAFVLELHHLLDDPSTKDDRVTLRSSDDEGAAYCETRWLADPEQAQPIEGGYLRVRFTGLPPGRFDCEVDPGEGPDGQRGRPYLLFRRATIRGATLEKEPPPTREDEPAAADDEAIDPGAPVDPGPDDEAASEALRALKERAAQDSSDDAGGDDDDDTPAPGEEA